MKSESLIFVTLKCCVIILLFCFQTFSQHAGDLDPSFSDNGIFESNQNISDFFRKTFKIAANGKIVFAGSWNSTIYVQRLNQDGTFDTTFDNDGFMFSNSIPGLSHIFDLVINSDNSMFILGFANNPDIDQFILKITNTGSIDTNFGVGGYLYFNGTNLGLFTNLLLQSNGKMVLSGSGIGVGMVQVIRLNSNGTFDLSFDGDGKLNINFNESSAYFVKAEFDKDENIVILANNTDFANKKILFAIIKKDGTYLSNFGQNGIAKVDNLEAAKFSIQSDGLIFYCYSASSTYQTFKLKNNGQMDNNFGTNGSNTLNNLSVFDFIIQKDDKILLGFYEVISNQLLFGVYRLNQNGTIDGSFGNDGKKSHHISGASSIQLQLRIQSDGKILFGGVIRDGAVIVRIHGVNSFTTNQGKVTTQFTTNHDEAKAIARRAGNKLIVLGNVTNAAGSTSGTNFGLVGYNEDGSLDYTFGSNGFVVTAFDANDHANALLVKPDGKILVTGAASDGLNYYLVLLQYNTDGTIDNSFGTNGYSLLEINSYDSEGYSLELEPITGKILVTGKFYESFYDEVTSILTRFNSNGTLDMSFGNDGVVYLQAGTDYFGKIIKIQQDSKILIICTSNLEIGNFKLIRLESNGNIDITFGTDGIVETAVGTTNSFANSLVIQSDNKILVSGSAKVNGIDVFAVVRYNQNGSLDVSFDTDGVVLTSFYPLKAISTAMAIQPDGKIFLTGKTTGTSNSDVVLTRYLGNGSLDDSFDSDGIIIQEVGYGNEAANAILSTANGVAYLAGYYHNGHDNDFLLVKLLPCYQESLFLLSPTENYPNPTLPNSQYAKNIYASNKLFPGAAITYQSEKAITLNPGFKVENGAVFKAEIMGCSY